MKRESGTLDNNLTSKHAESELQLAAALPTFYRPTAAAAAGRPCPVQDTGTRCIVKCLPGDEKKKTHTHTCHAARHLLSARARVVDDSRRLKSARDSDKRARMNASLSAFRELAAEVARKERRAKIPRVSEQSDTLFTI